MEQKRLKKLEARARVLKAMAHASRLMIIEELARKACNVGELTEKIGADTSTVSKHLTLLKSTGIIQDAKRGQNVYYTLRCPCVLNFYACVEGVIQKNLSAQMELTS